MIPADPEFVPPDGAPIIEPDESDEANKMIGHVTAGGYSPNLGHSIALAQLKNGRDRIGDSVAISTVKRIVEATLSPTPYLSTPAVNECGAELMAYDVNIFQRPPYGLLNLRGIENVRRHFNGILGF